MASTIARQLLHAIALGIDVADGQRVEHRGDAGCDDLRIVAHHRRCRWPVHTGTRAQMLFQVIGVQFDQPRQQVIAVQILRLRQVADAFSTSLIRPSRRTTVPVNT
jgi:hypothetical protein